jgi:hypothetical protein
MSPCPSRPERDVACCRRFTPAPAGAADVVFAAAHPGADDVPASRTGTLRGKMPVCHAQRHPTGASLVKEIQGASLLAFLL